MAVAQYRGRHSVARKKPDHIEVLTLANILRLTHMLIGGYRRSRPRADDRGARSRCSGCNLAVYQGHSRTTSLVDRGTKGSKFHVLSESNGIPLGCRRIGRQYS
nr:hypothetical protein GCM10017611_73970 [Rhodococcus wratislaviensis]